MEQYHELLKVIKAKGILKPAARPGMPGTISRFGYQFRHDLADGFPAMTTKKLYWKGVVIELIWFLKGDTNTKFLNDNGVTFWNADSVNYMNKVAAKQGVDSLYGSSDEEKDRFTEDIKRGVIELNTPHPNINNFQWGDCGYQYGKLWRDWDSVDFVRNTHDQIKELIAGLKKSPEGRRHIITAWDPAHLDDMALNACHVMAQFNCRPLSKSDKEKFLNKNFSLITDDWDLSDDEYEKDVTFEYNVPNYYLDCLMLQRSADVFLGVPLNIASYALLTHILCEICNFIPGEYIHTFGDVHIYEDHMDAVDLQMTREIKKLPRLKILNPEKLKAIEDSHDFDLNWRDFILEGYDPDPTIPAHLSTGLK